MKKRNIIFILLASIFIVGIGVLVFRKNIILWTMRTSINQKSFIHQNIKKILPEREQTRDPRQKHLPEIQELLGTKTSKTFLIALMNASELKPNGGFFGSYLLITLSPHTYNWEIVDAYEPHIANKHSIPTPKRFREIIDLEQLGFLGGNWRGFTDQDGKHLMTLFEQNNGKKLDGIIFINSRIGEHIDQQRQKNQIEREFINAQSTSTPLTGSASYKQKTIEIFKKQFTFTNTMSALDTITKNREQIRQNNRIQIYLPNNSNTLQNTLIEQKLSTIYNPDLLYLWDYNFGANKVDKFVTKSRSLRNKHTQVISTGRNDRIDISPLQSGNYELTILYELNIPDNYDQLLEKLEKKHGPLTRENQKITMLIRPQWRTQGIIYLPQNTKIIDIQGDMYMSKSFGAPRAQGGIYRFTSQGLRSDTKEIRIQLQKS